MDSGTAVFPYEHLSQQPVHTHFQIISSSSVKLLFALRTSVILLYLPCCCNWCKSIGATRMRFTSNFCSHVPLLIGLHCIRKTTTFLLVVFLDSYFFLILLSFTLTYSYRILQKYLFFTVLSLFCFFCVTSLGHALPNQRRWRARRWSWCLPNMKNKEKHNKQIVVRE